MSFFGASKFSTINIKISKCLWSQSSLSFRTPMRRIFGDQLDNCKAKIIPCGLQRCYHSSMYRDHKSSYRRKYLQSQHLYTVQERTFWGLDEAFNKVDSERVRLAGPDRACAEWILRNGGSIRWTSTDKFLKDFNLLPSTNFEAYKLETLDLTDTLVTGQGFAHLENLEHVKSIRLHYCRSMGDDALHHLRYVKDTLQYLEISKCPMITENGLARLQELKNLKEVIVYDLVEVRNFESAMSKLQKSIPWCKLITSDPNLSGTG